MKRSEREVEAENRRLRAQKAELRAQLVRLADRLIEVVGERQEPAAAPATEKAGE